MARQKSLIKLQGTLGDITFVKTKDGYLAKERTSINGSRIATDPAFQRTRENNAEFGRAGKAGKILRAAFRGQLQKAADGRVASRLTKAMLLVIQADSTSIRGARNVLDGETELLQGFDFNVNSSLATTLFAPFTATINRSSGDLEIKLPPLETTNVIAAPSGSTHFRFFAAGAEINFETGNFIADTSESELLSLKTPSINAIDLSLKVPAGSSHPIFLTLGIAFVQEVNGTTYSLKNGSFNALAIVKVSGL